MDNRDQVIEAAKVWKEKTGKSYATLSHSIMGNGTWIDKVINGADLTSRTHRKAKNWFEERGIKFDELEVAPDKSHLPAKGLEKPSSPVGGGQ
ncbi:MAG: hypothetical protein MRY32_06635 [Rickettsiales bacterium]|nr:hypothetical protein [Rickettsiales bacterium]